MDQLSMKNVGVKKIWIRKNIKKNKKYGLAFDKKRGCKKI